MSGRYSMSERIQHGWNAFRNKDPSDIFEQTFTNVPMVSSSYRPDRQRPRYVVDPTMINAIFTRMAIDAAASTFEHIRADADGGYLDTIHSGLNNVLNVEANIDQTGQEFLFEMIASMLDEGCVAAVPVDTKTNPELGLVGVDIETMRIGKVVNWMPEMVDVELFNEQKGIKQNVRVMKRSTAILTNPFYSVMNEPNSTLKRLNRRLALLDVTDERVGSSKLDMIIQVPYSVRSDTRAKYAEKRKNEIVSQLQTSEYGIAYADGTEKIIQLNRPVENNLMANIEYLTNLLFSQLGLSPSIFDMTATEQTMTNYYKRQIDPINDTIVNEFRRKFISKTARSQGQTIWHHAEPFKFTQTSSLADIADKMIRNRVLTGNEMRGVIGYKPIDDPRADELWNPNMPLTDVVVNEEVQGGGLLSGDEGTE